MKKILIIAAVIALFASGLAFAVGSVSSVDTSISATSATTGTSVVLTATSTASSEDVSNVQIQLIKDSGPGDFSVSDPSGGSYTATVTTSGTSKTFTFTAGSAGTYNYKVTDTWSGGSKSSTTETMSFVAPSSLSVSGSASAATITQGQSTGLTVNVQNSQASNILTSYSLTYDSTKLSLAGDPTSSSGTTVNAGTTKSLAWTITHSSCFTGTKTVVFALGDNTDAHTLTITGNSSCTTTTTTTTTSTGGGGGGGAAVNVTTKETKSFSTLANVAKLLAFTQVASTGLTEIEIRTTAAKTNVQISAASSSKPSGAPDVIAASAGTVYSYMDITKANVTDSDLSMIKIRFKLPKSWVTTNSIDSLKVALYRYSSGSWTKLLTTQTSGDGTNYYYEAISPGFSVFAVAGEKTAAVPEAAAPSLTIVSPVSGSTVVGPAVEVTLSVSGVRLAAPTGTVVEGEGHFHVWLDDANEQRGAKTAFTFENVSLGQHTLRAELHRGDHSAFSPAVVKTVTFTVSAEAGEAAETPSVQLPMDTNTLIGILVIVIAVIFGAVHHFLLKKKKPKSSYSYGAGK